MILVDSSVWIDHLHSSRSDLRAALEKGVVCTHPFVLGELACGTLARRQEVLNGIADLPALSTASHMEAMQLLERRQLWGRGLAWIDVHLLAAAIVGGASLWTLDKHLASAANELRVSYRD